MKHLFASIALITFFISSVYTQDHFKKYPVKSGKIVYQCKGTSSGTETLYFDDYGYKQAHYINKNVSMLEMPIRYNLIKISYGTVDFTVNLDENTATQSNNPFLEKLDKSVGYEEYEQQKTQFLGLTKTGTEKINDKECNIYEGEDKLWIWKGLVLKEEMKTVDGKATMEATSIQTNITIPAEKFRIPKGIEVIQEEVITIESDNIPISQ